MSPRRPDRYALTARLVVEDHLQLGADAIAGATRAVLSVLPARVAGPIAVELDRQPQQREGGDGRS